MPDRFFNRSVLSMILAGGQGERLYPLTRDRAKPAVPFGGRYRIVDFVINNFINSGFYKLKVLTQFKSNSLIEHITRTWRLSSDIGQYVDCVPAQMRRGPFWFRGTADAVYQNLDLIFDEQPEHVCVFGGDHIYKMDIGQMLSWHLEKDADLTIATVPVPVAEAKDFGILEIDESGRVLGFEEKPQSNPKTIPGRPDTVLASMGNYIFRAHTMIETLEHDALDDTSHDFGKTIIPSMLAHRTVYAYDFSTNEVPGEFEGERGYWRDVGTLDAFWTANMDLISVTPRFNLYNPLWPLKSAPTSNPPAKFVFADQLSKRIGVATNSMVAHGCIISGGTIDRSILFPRAKINSFSHVEESILMDGVEVGRYARVRRAIVDKGVRIPQHAEIGYDIEQDRARFTVTDSGIVVIPKGTVLDGMAVRPAQSELDW